MASPTRSTSVRVQPELDSGTAHHSGEGLHRSPPVMMNLPPRQQHLDLLREALFSSDDDELEAHDDSEDYLHTDFVSLFDVHSSDRPERPAAWLPCLPPLARELYDMTLANLPVDVMLTRAAEKIARGMEVTAIDARYGRSVLHWACILASPDLVGWLLCHGAAAHLNLPDHQGQSVIGCTHALRIFPGTGQIIDALLSAGVTLASLPYRGAELLYRKDLPVTVIRKLLRAGVNVDGGGAFESTPLISGCGCANWGAASVLLELNADVRRRGAFGMSVLHNPRLPVWLAEQFRRRGADVNAKDMLGETPLMLACAQGNLPLVRWLVSHGARADEVATDLRTVADYAAMGGPEVTGWLVRHGQLGCPQPATAQSPQC